MLRSLNSYRNQTLDARDGTIGKVHDFLFEDDSWAIRYAVADTRRWLPGRKVLIAAEALGQPDPVADNLPVDLSREQIQSSPDIDTDQPVSRQHQLTLHRHYGWPFYWSQPTPMGGPLMAHPDAAAIPTRISPPDAASANDAPKISGDPHLRSLREVQGYHIQAKDDRVGHVDDLLFSDEDWIVRYLVVDTRNWLPGKKVLLPPDWRVERISWSDRTVIVDLDREAIRGAPEFEPELPVSRDYEQRLYDHYGRPGYWQPGAELPTRK